MVYSACGSGATTFRSSSLQTSTGQHARTLVRNILMRSQNSCLSGCAPFIWFYVLCLYLFHRTTTVAMTAVQHIGESHRGRKIASNSKPADTTAWSHRGQRVIFCFRKNIS